MHFVKVIKEDRQDRLRVIKCNSKGQRVGKLFVTFPNSLRKENTTYLVRNLKTAKTNNKKYWVALKRNEIVSIPW